jgi:hypothetical protein
MQRIIISLTFLIVATAAIADTTITYQGRLQQAGEPHSGTANLEFRLYDELTDGSQVGDAEERLDWPVEDGLFQVELDFGAGAFDGSPRFLEVSVDDTVLSPRQAIRPAPMALHALSGSGSGSPFTLDPDTGKIEYLFDDQVIRFEPMRDEFDRASPAIVMGHAANVASAPGAVVSGGGFDFSPNFDLLNRALSIASTVAGGVGNTASGGVSTIGGGDGNTASGEGSTVGGGVFNRASGRYSTVAGGWGNSASGDSSTVGAGSSNCAGGDYSWAGGLLAKVRPATDPETGACSGLTYPGGSGDEGTFIWADSTGEDFVSTGPNQFRVRATGGAHFEAGSFGLRSLSDSSSTSGAAVQAESTNPGGIAITGRNESDDATMVLNNRGTGRLIRAFTGGTELMRLENNGDLWIAGTLTQNSDRNQKEAIEPVNVDDVLNRLAGLDISSWRYLRSDNGVRHIGPMAQDFYAAFGFGVSNITISTIDAQGIAFAAIQALNQRLMDSNDELHAEVDALKSQSDRMQELADRNAALEKRLTALESLLLDDSQVAEISP